jgi:hypothetical protein
MGPRKVIDTIAARQVTFFFDLRASAENDESFRTWEKIMTNLNSFYAAWAPRLLSVCAS